MKIGALLMAVACGSSRTTPVSDAPARHDAPTLDAPKVDAASPDAPPGTEPLTVKNYSSWCSVSVNGGMASSAATQVVTVAPGTITLTASPFSSAFALGAHMWHHTTGDTGIGEPGTVTGTQSAAAATVGTVAKCVWVCCPFTVDATSCDQLDQCP